MKELLSSRLLLVSVCALAFMPCLQVSKHPTPASADRPRGTIAAGQVGNILQPSESAGPRPNCGIGEAGIPCAGEVWRALDDASVYRKSPDDSIALGSLLEAAGYAVSSNSDWKDVSAGNFCGGSEPELVLLKNKHSHFSILRGPAPFAVGTGDLTSSLSNPWRAVAAANLDGGSYDEIVAVRKKTAAGVPDLVITKANDSSCNVTTVVGSANVGNASNSEWLDVAVGRFDRSGANRIALLKAAHSNLFLVDFAPPGTLTVFHASDLTTIAAAAWKTLAAGDIDGDGVDELIAARQVSDNRSATVLAYKWNGSGFQVFATSTFGNNGNSDWSGATVADFNADGREAIVLAKNRHSNFVVLDFPAGASELRVLATSDLNSAAEQGWRGVTATDWIRGNDDGAAELIAVRAARDPYRTDLFIYGDPSHRISRERAIERTKSQWDHDKAIPIPLLKSLLGDTHTNTLNFFLYQPEDYLRLVEFLDCTRGFCVDGKQLRVWVTLVPPRAVTLSGGRAAFYCSFPRDSELTAWPELDYFPTAQTIGERCRDYLGWASLIGRLAQDYPHLVAVGIDDFMGDLDYFSGDYVAEMESRMRSASPWLNFVPTVYRHDFYVPPTISTPNRNPDVGLTFDTMLFYFRNEKAGQCLSGACGEASIANAADEFADVGRFLAQGRKLQLGVYFGILWSGPGAPQEGTVLYDYNLSKLVLDQPSLGGATAYPAQTDNLYCTEVHYLDYKYCALQKVYGDHP
jgi:VCBS repeat protein